MLGGMGHVVNWNSGSGGDMLTGVTQLLEPGIVTSVL